MLANRFLSPSNAIHKRRKAPRPFFVFTKKTAAYSVLALFVIYALWTLLFTRTFSIDFVDVKAEGSLDSTLVREMIFRQMEESHFGVLSQKNIFFFNARSVEQRLRDGFVVERLAVKKILPNKLSISVSGSPFRALWFSAGTFYDITTRGTISRTVSPSQVPLLPKELSTSQKADVQPKPSKPAKEKKQKNNEASKVLRVPILLDSKDNQETQIGGQVIDPSALAFVISLAEKLETLNAPMVWGRHAADSGDVRIMTNERWEAIFNMHESLDSQVGYLKTVLAEKIKRDRSKLQYIDVRFENKIFYALH